MRGQAAAFGCRPGYGFPVLLEREGEQAALAGVLAAGGLVLVEGEPGIGKTALLAWLGERAAELGLVVRCARGAELERSFAFGVARQLVGEPPEGDEFAVLNALFWRVAGERTALIVDDAQWATHRRCASSPSWRGASRARW